MANASTGQWRLKAMGAVTFLPSRRECIKAAGWLAPDTLCTVLDPKGQTVFGNASAASIAGLGRPLGAHLRLKAQRRRSR
jgi:hypothetical protein